MSIFLTYIDSEQNPFFTLKTKNFLDLTIRRVAFLLILLLLSFNVGGQIAVLTNINSTEAYLISMAALHLLMAYIKYVFDRNFELITKGRCLPNQPNLPIFYIIVSATATMIMLIGMLRLDLPIWVYSGIWLCSFGCSVLVWAILYALGQWLSTCWFAQFIYRWEEGMEPPAFVFPDLTFDMSWLRKLISALSDLTLVAIIFIAALFLIAFGLLYELGHWLRSLRVSFFNQKQKVQTA